MVARPKSYRLHEHARSDARRKTGDKPTATVCAPQPTADGFLTHCFAPIYPNVEELSDQQNVETDFFKSVSYLSDLYSLSLDALQLEWAHDYPFNIQYSYQLVADKLKAIQKDVEVLIVSDETRRAVLATVQQFDTDYYSYFVPVKPLWLLHKAGKRKPLTQLLESIYAYLFHVSGLPFLSDVHSYVYYQCDMMMESRSEWTGREERKEYTAFKKILKQGRRGSQIIRNRINQTTHLKNFDRRFSAFQPESTDETEFKTIARTFLDLYTRFPTRSIWDSYHIGLINPDEEYRIHPDQFISFIWDFDDGIYDDLVQSLDADFNGGGYVELPQTVQMFDQPQPVQTLNLEFEETFFTTVGSLISSQHKLSSDAKYY